MRLLKPANLLDVVHEVTPVHILHHEVQAVLGEGSQPYRQHPVFLRFHVESRDEVGFRIKTPRTPCQAPIFRTIVPPKAIAYTQLGIGGT